MFKIKKISNSFGFAHVIVLVLVAGVIGLLGASVAKVVKTAPPPEVQGEVEGVQSQNQQAVDLSEGVFDLSTDALSIGDEEDGQSQDNEDEDLKNLDAQFEEETAGFVSDKTPKNENSIKAEETIDAIEPQDNVSITPSDVVAAVKQSNTSSQTHIEKVELQNSGSRKVFRVTGKKTGAIFGILPVESNFVTDVDTITGQVISTSQAGWWRNIEGFLR